MVSNTLHSVDFHLVLPCLGVPFLALPCFALCFVAAVVSVLQSPPTGTESPASVVEYGLRAIVNLLVGNDVNRANLTNQCAIEGAVLLAVTVNISYHFTVCWLWTLGSSDQISSSSPSSSHHHHHHHHHLLLLLLLCRLRYIFDFVLPGMFAVVVAALESSLALASPAVVKYGLWAIKNLAARNGGRRALMGECGACAGYYTIAISHTTHCRHFLFLQASFPTVTHPLLLVLLGN